MERGNKKAKKRIQRSSKQSQKEETKVGIYKLGYSNIELILDPNLCGGSFSTTGGKGGLPLITIGSKDSKWNEVVQVLIHEALELTFSNLQGRFIQDWTTDVGSDTYIFMLNHSQFSEACSRVGDFITVCISDLCDAYKHVTNIKPTLVIRKIV